MVDERALLVSVSSTHESGEHVQWQIIFDL